jgi:cytidylate kinase
MRPGEVRRLSQREASSVAAPHPDAAGAKPAKRTAPADRLSAEKPKRDGLIVSLDGPGSSGKSTVGTGAAGQLGYRFCDTGLLYRALTWLVLERGVDPSDEEAVAALVPKIELAEDAKGRLTHVHVDGRDVTSRVHSAHVDRSVSEVARPARVRAALLPRQRAIVAPGRIIMAGRDIGTVVVPDADLKLFLHVSPEERARRRAEDRGMHPDGPEAERMAAELRRRDEIDSTRTVAPLKVPEGATIIESDGNTLEQTINAVVEAIRRREQEIYGE